LGEEERNSCVGTQTDQIGEVSGLVKVVRETVVVKARLGVR
jgi:hypothetical protein